MENSQLIIILRSLTREEFKDFGKFVRSPYFNNREEVTRCYDALKEFYPQFSPKKLSEEYLFKKVYPKKKFSDVLMRKLVSLMVNQAMSFFIVSGFLEDELSCNVRLVDKLREKKLDQMFDKKRKALDEQFKSAKHSSSFYESKFKYTSILNGHHLHTNESSMVSGFQNELDDFIEYFLSVALLLYIRLSEWSRGYNIRFDLKFFEEVISFIEKNDYKEVPIVYLYYNMLMLLNTEDEKYFHALVESKNRFEEKIFGIDNYNIAIVIIQYCFKRVQKGDESFRRHQFEAVNTIIEKDLIPPGHIEPYFFTNSVRNASIIGEFKWCEEFIERYRQRVNEDIADEIISYSYALTEFYRKNFERALSCISAINPERSSIKMELKNIQLMIYYELKYDEELESLIDSYRHFLHRDKDIIPQAKEKVSEFLRYISKLLKIRSAGDIESAAILKKEIEKSQYFSFKDWLVEMLSEIS